MAEPEVADELEQLVAHARGAQPRPLGALSARSLVKRVLARQAEQTARTARRTRLIWLAAAAVLLLGVLSYAHLRRAHGTEIAVAPDGLPLRLSLETGDTLVLAPAARLSVLSERPALRSVRLERGDALFEVARSTPEQRFEVLTPHARVRVQGTVFSVRVAEKRSVVRVHEGSVRVDDVLLETGSIWTSDGRPPTTEERDTGTWTADIRAALDARAASKLRVAPEDLPSTAIWQPAPVAPVALAPASEGDAAAVANHKAAHPAPTDQRAHEEHELPDIHQLRELVRLGNFHQVVYFARQRSEQDDAFALILADGLRALGRLAEACTEYEQLALRAPKPLQTQAAFAAAQLALLKLDDARRALRDIELYALSRSDSPLAERASVLHVQALVRLGQLDAARAVAARYIAREPDTEAKQRVRELVDPLLLWRKADPPSREGGPAAPPKP